MSRPAWEYLTNNLPEIRRATYPDPSSKTGTRPLGEPGLALLLYLSGQTNKQGEFFMTAKAMQEETGMATVRQVEKLLAAFIALGWITPTGETVQYNDRGRPTPVYVLTLFPQYAQRYAASLQKSDHIPSGETVEKTTEPNTERKTRIFLRAEPEPQPEPQPEDEPQPQPGQGAGMGKGEEWGKECDDLLAQVLDRENYQGARNPDKVRKYKAQEYEAIVRYAIQAQPASDLVTWCLMQKNPQQAASRYPQTVTTSVRTYLPELTQAYGANPDCKHCKGAGIHNVRTPDDMGWTTARCVCTGGDHTSSTTTTTPKRVDTDESANTDIPVPSAEADPQLAMTELTKRLRLPK
jgi:hypothetical protein